MGRGNAQAERAPIGRVGERAQQLLKMLVEHYLADGVPVASKTLASATDVTVSSATVRNVMADLEARGLVVSPHPSAGKVPTHQGLRFFVDSLISVQPMDDEVVGRIRGGLDPGSATASTRRVGLAVAVAGHAYGRIGHRAAT